MMIAFHVICLSITLLVLSQYMETETHSRVHRLLPLVLGFISIYNFLQIIQCFVGQQMYFTCMEDMLLLMIAYTMIHYCMSFCSMRLPWGIEAVLYTSLLAACPLLCSQMTQPQNYLFCYRVYAGVFGSSFLILCAYTYYKYSFSKKEYRVTYLLYLAVFLPVVALLLRGGELVPGEMAMSGALMGSNLILLFLIRTGQLIDAASVMQENLFATADIAMVLFDSDFYYLDSNRAADELFPKGMAEIKKNRGEHHYLSRMDELADLPGSPTEAQVQDRYVKCWMEPYYQRGRLRGYILSIIDITGQKQETMEMERLKEQAETQAVLKSRFLARMSHDLRSPLNAILGVSNILASKEELSEHNRTLVSYVYRAGNTLLELVNSILLYSKLESGKVELVRKSYSLEELVEELACMSVINLQSRPVEVSVCFRTEYPKTLFGDPVRVREMVQNLMSNAVKFTEQGQINCEIDCIREPGENRVLVRCRVSDTGPGMNENQMAQIFEEYVSFADSKQLEGSGLGLCIVKQLAELMGGTAYAESDGHSGSMVAVEFYQELSEEIFLPAHSHSGREVLAQSVRMEQAIKPNYCYPGACVLLADDMKVNQEIFRGLVEPWQFEIDTVSSGAEAVEAVKKREYQLIFLDQMMPEMTGTEAADIIKEYCQTPLIMLSADLSDSNRRECVQHGFRDFLSKPIKASRLQKMIENYMPQGYRRWLGAEKGKPAAMTVTTAVEQRVMKTYLEEIRPLVEKLPEYAKEDLDMFRVKVHGIKGTSRQIGRLALSEAAEIMEMAAKTENRTFINSHLDDFLERLKKNLAEVETEVRLKEAAGMTATSRETENGMQNDTEAETEPETEVSVKKLFQQLKKAFDGYDLSGMEESIQILERQVLSSHEAELLRQSKVACNELEYEAGSECLAEYVEQE